MRDAFGGLVNLVIIIVFLVIVSGYLAFNVNYTKAFRVKNKIITTYEQYEGACTDEGGQCRTTIYEYMDKLGYDRTSEINITETGAEVQKGKGYVALKYKVESTGAVAERNRCYYKIITRITIDIPIINKVMGGVSIFQITGDTKTMDC